MKKRKKIKSRVKIHPVMTFIILILIVIISSFVLSLLNTSSTYYSISSVNGEYISTTESVNSLLNLRGFKYIFSNTVSNFANFTVLSHLIIVLLGIGVMEYSGFLKTAVGFLTKKAKKNTTTFVIILIGILASIVDNMPFIAFIPLSAMIFKYGKRNPGIGIVASFASLTCGYGISLFFTGVDTSLSKITATAAGVLFPNYNIGVFSMLFIMLVAVIILSIALTLITENVVARKFPKYEFEESEVLDDEKLTKPQTKGLVLAAIGSIIYLLIFVYNIIPGLPLSGNFLNYSEILYIDKLFGADSFFASGFVFIITILFVIWGLLYGIGAKTITNNRQFVEGLGYSLNGIGKTLVFIFASATFISIFKQSNIGSVVVVALSNLVSNSRFSGLPLIILLFLVTAIATLFVPSTITKWNIMASSVIPTFLNVGISGEFTQLIFRLGESVTLGLTPLFAYYIVYLAYLEKYCQNDSEISLLQASKYQLPYSLITTGLFLALIVIWYVISIPLGISGSVSI